MAPTGDITLSYVAIAGRAVATGSTVIAACANPVAGLEQFREMMRLLVEDKEALKVFVNVAS